MKTRKILFVLVSNLLVWGPGAAGEPQGTVRSISVTGTVETKTAPDLIVWRVSLTDTGKDLRAAKATNDEKVRSVIALREKLGIEEGDLETGHLSIRREYERGQHGYRKQFRHFVITR
ncbi:MAG: SIMPL domain-containing protein, partial [Planctomycetota bacterium]|nr:SIMPL domain-containing protein [Planctomycetota bacterium]